MDFNQLVEEIVARVAAKIEAESAPVAVPVDSGKPKLLILTQEHGTLCHQMLESPRLAEYYQTECALLQDYQCALESYEAVILFGLDLELMGRLSGGLCETPAFRLAQKALLLGKKVFVPQETVELLKYADSAPAAYYQHLYGQLTLLQQAGMTICPLGNLEEAILSGECASAVKPPAPVEVIQVPTAAPAAPAASGDCARLDKRIVTERDVNAVYKRGMTTVYVCQKAIITDLAREYAQARGVEIVRD